jgi:hypothetical protein
MPMERGWLGEESERVATSRHDLAAGYTVEFMDHFAIPIVEWESRIGRASAHA